MSLQDITNNVYVGEFRPTCKQVRFWFAVYNQLIFRGKIARFRYIIIKYYPNQLAHCEGKWDAKKDMRYYNLQMHPRFNSFKTFISILVHEMIHAHQWVNEERDDMSHGSNFFKWKKKLERNDIILSIKYFNKKLPTNNNKLDNID